MNFTAEATRSVIYPIPKGWKPDAVLDINMATLDQARYIYRVTKNLSALRRWEKLALELAEAAESLEEMIFAHYEAPEGGPACLLSLAKWDNLSLATVEAANGYDNLKHLLEQLGTGIAPEGKAKTRLIEKLQPFCLRR
jgi:hypothetical protein